MSIREKTLQLFLEKHKDLPEQGTKEWLESRTYFIGGSSMATILGKNPYENEKKLIKNRIGLDSFKGFAATWHGNLMEPILQDYINNHFNCKIYETGSIKCTKHDYISYSPDGLSIIKKENLINIFDKTHYEHIKNTSIFQDENDESDELSILFEFKCPYKRIPHITDIPEYYLPQPLLGMEVIDMCEAGIFIEAIYRYCSLEDIQYNNNYNHKYHNDKNVITDNPIYYGFMAITYDIYADESDVDDDDFDFLDQLEKQNRSVSNIENYLNKDKIIKTNINNNIINDLGKIRNSWLFNQILEHIISKKEFKYNYINHKKEHIYDKEIYNKNQYIKNVYNYSIQFNIKEEITNIIDNLPDNEILIGILPYKLFNIYMKPVNKQLKYITPKIQEDVNKVIDIIKVCNEGNKTITEKEEILKSIYPAKRRKKKV